MNLVKLLFIGLFSITSSLPQDQPVAGGKKQTPPAEKMIRGSFDVLEGKPGFMLVEGRIFLKAIVIHEAHVESGVFLLDSETTSGCVLEQFFAEKMEIEELGQVTVKLGETELENLKTTVHDRPELRQIFKEHTAVFQNQPICGVLGLPVLLSRKTVLDFERCTLSFPPASPPPDSEEIEKEDVAETAWTVPFQNHARVLWIQAQLNGKETATFLFSTGCVRSWIGKEAAEKTGLRNGGSPAEMKMGGRLLSKPPVFAIRESSDSFQDVPDPVTGVLGTDFLSSYIVTVEPEQKRLILETR